MENTSPILEFHSRDLQALSGLSKYMVDYLCRHGLLSASRSSARGYGMRRRFSFTDVLLARALRKLLEAGVSVLAMRAVMSQLGHQLQSTTTHVLRDTRVVICRGKPYLSELNKPPADLLAGGQLAFSFVLEVEDLWRKAEPLEAKRKLALRQRVDKALRTRKERIG